MGLFRLKKRRLRGNFITLYNCLKGSFGEVWANLFYCAFSERTTGNGLKLTQGRFTSDIYKNITISDVRHWKWLSKEVKESPSLEVSNRCVDLVLGDVG